MLWGLTTIYSHFFTLMYGFSGIEDNMEAIQIVNYDNMEAIQIVNYDNMEALYYTQQ